MIVGTMGYQDERKPDTTPIYLLDLETFAIASVQATGTPPDWVNRHQATLANDGAAILITGGFNAEMVENIDDWSLRIADWHWTRLTDRQWAQWEVKRTDQKLNGFSHHKRAAIESLYSPPVPHTPLPDQEDEFRVHRIEVDGVIVRYATNSWSIHLTIEGQLPVETMAALTADLLQKFSALENAPSELKPL